ncbi:hypothetical protein KKH26_03115 [Patescibacteria group bacterium]|nr:hypothetical protein [Patescibacteria group bacterium]
MVNKKLLERLRKLGYPLFETEETHDANATLAEVVKSKDFRLWEGFPVVLANSAEKGLFDYDLVRSYLQDSTDKGYLRSLLLMSLALYRALNIKFSWADRFYKNLSSKDKKQFNDFLKKLKEGQDFKVLGHDMPRDAGCVMSGQRLKQAFNNYFNQVRSELGELLSTKEELGLEYALSRVFSPKQKELFLKKLKGERLTKTEKEYFSRVVKKKVLALANPELHRLAERLLN